MSKKTIYILIIIILIIAGIFVATKITENDNAKPVVANTLSNTNKTDERNVVEENNIVESAQNDVVNDVENNELKNDNTKITPEEKAKQIVKNNWGEDDTVYFSYDGIKDGKHVVCVRETSTTKALYRYYVDLETETCEIE